MDETSKTFIKWEKFLRKNPSLTAPFEADPALCAQLLANQEEFEKETILDIARKTKHKKSSRHRRW